MKKILVFGMTDNPGGVESVIMNYYRNINRNEIQFDFLCNYSKMVYEDEVNSLGGKVFYITPRRKSIRQFRIDLDNFMKECSSNYVAIWVNICTLANIDYLIWAKKYGISKRIIHCHNSNNDAGMIKFLLHSFNKLRIGMIATDFWSCSEKASKWFYSDKIIKSDNYKVIPNAINIDKYAFDVTLRKKVREEYNLSNKIVIGHIGRFQYQKNHKYLIAVFELLIKRNENFHLLLVGQGELEDDIKRYVEEKKLKDNVTFVGVTNHIEELYQAMDIFVLPSFFEGVAVVAIEAQANGLPCLFADTISSEVEINSNVYFLSLSDDKSEWCSMLEQLAQTNRILPNVLKESCYNIQKQAKNFEESIITIL